MSFYDYTFGLCIPPQVGGGGDNAEFLSEAKHELRTHFTTQQNILDCIKYLSLQNILDCIITFPSRIP